MTTLTEIETVVAAYEAALKARQALPERIPIENEELSAQAREMNAVIFSAWNALTDVAADAVFVLLPIAHAATDYVDSLPAFDHDDSGKRAALVEAVNKLKGVAGE